MVVIYHVTTAAEWEEAKSKGFYEAPSLQAEGFIHCSEAHQVSGVLERYFSNKSSLVKLHIDTDKLQHRLVYEHSPSVNESFPHIYGFINLDAVIQVDPI